MSEYVISYCYRRGNKNRSIVEKTFPTVEKAKNAVKSMLDGNYYNNFMISELQPIISVKLPEPSWIEIKTEKTAKKEISE